VSPYAELLGLAERQADALRRGDLESAVGLLDARGALLARAGAPSRQDVDAIRAVLRLDRELSGALRARMIELRNAARGLHTGRQALDGYGRAPAPHVSLDRAG
jgi:hypothetical protein